MRPYKSIYRGCQRLAERKILYGNMCIGCTGICYIFVYSSSERHTLFAAGNLDCIAIHFYA